MNRKRLEQVLRIRERAAVATLGVWIGGVHYAARDGFSAAALALVDGGLDVNVRSDGDKSTHRGQT